MFSFRINYRIAYLCQSIAIGAIASVMHVSTTHAAPTTITYTHRHHIFTVSVVSHPEWKSNRKEWLYRGQKAVPPAELLSCGPDEVLPDGWTVETISDWNTDAIALTLQALVADKFDRAAGEVTISRNSSGSVIFDGFGLPGQTIELAKAAALTRTALQNNIGTVVLPVIITQPKITVTDPALTDMGITEVVTVGESAFVGSPKNRQHNIGVGIKKFNGHLIPKGSIFSFNKVLGPVNGQTGYLKELVIQGEKTVPDFGGGLCQVSSTAYRGAWEYGLPMEQRKNHSYAVSYYGPVGTDATIYPPNVDLKFTNNTPGALLIQAFVTEDLKAYFVYYGTHDDRKTEVFGPYIFDYRPAPRAELTIYSTDKPVGSKTRVSERHDGMKVNWYRALHMPGQPEKIERVFSSYDDRQLTYEVGVEPDSLPTATGGLLSPAPISATSRN
ncbi:MAG: VanW family protein [Candidatus Peribacteraceae bacterium]|nr:VanW family protein [Candidatus Peribacteraceae bacterium]